MTRNIHSLTFWKSQCKHGPRSWQSLLHGGSLIPPETSAKLAWPGVMGMHRILAQRQL